MRTLRQLALLPLLVSTLHAEPAAMRVGYFDLPPHASTSDGQPDGAAVRYFRLVAERMKVPVQFNNYPLSRLLDMLEQGELDAALILARNPEREARFVYASLPLFSTDALLAVRKDSGLSRAEQLASTSSLTIGIWQGGYQSPLLDSTRNKRMPIAGDQVAQRGIDMVLAHRIDAFFSPDGYALRDALSRHPLAKQLRLLTVPGERVPLYTVFSKKADARYRSRFEAALREQEKRLSYSSLLNQPANPAR